MRWLGACVRWVGLSRVFKLLALCHALSVSPIDNLLVLASVTLIDRASTKTKKLAISKWVSSVVGQNLGFNTVFPVKGCLPGL